MSCAPEATEKTDTETLNDIMRALNTCGLFSDPGSLDISADEIDCRPDCEDFYPNLETGFYECEASGCGGWCRNDVAETLRALARVSRSIPSKQSELFK